MEFEMLEGLDKIHFLNVMVPNFLALVAIPSDPEPKIEVDDRPTRTDIEDDEQMERTLEIMEAVAEEDYEKIEVFFDASEAVSPECFFRYHPDKLPSPKLYDSLVEFGREFSQEVFRDYGAEYGGEGTITLDIKAWKVSATCIDRCMHDYPREDVELDMAAWALANPSEEETE
jgi:hypothetical protein